jgi:hypothetical protein
VTRKTALWVLAVVAVLVIVFSVFWGPISRVLLLTMEDANHHTATGEGYAFFSGIGSDLTEVLVLGGLIALYRKHNCNVKGCWRIQWREYVDADGTKHLWCRHHHPDKPVLLRDVESFVREHEARKSKGPRDAHATSSTGPASPAAPGPATPSPPGQGSTP